MKRSEPNPGLERVRFSLRADGVKPETPNPQRSGIHSRGYLPHVKREGASYFVTFRLADSLPQDVLMSYQTERAERFRRFLAGAHAHISSTSPPSDTEQEINRDYSRKIERYLDKGIGNCFLQREEIARLVANAIRHFDRKRYILGDWVVMPNHVHAILWLMPNELLGEILKSWKGYTGRESNKMLGRTGHPFWQTEAFDHWIRDDDEKNRITRYVRNNPVTVGLCSTPEEWRWGSAWPGWSQQDANP